MWTVETEELLLPARLQLQVISQAADKFSQFCANCFQGGEDNFSCESSSNSREQRPGGLAGFFQSFFSKLLLQLIFYLMV